jgi:predicted DNA-binding protein
VILINKNTTNKVILTLSEKTTLTNAKYLFEVINDMSNTVKCFIAADISTNKLRYNEFYFIENATEDLLNGTFSLTLSGFYKYNVYEQASTTNLDPLLALNLIDKGKLNVVSQLSDYPVYTGNENNTVVYGG